MIKELRRKFNSEFTESRYNNFLNDIWSVTKGEVDFRICETPLFLDTATTEKLIEASQLILSELNSEEFEKHSLNAIPQNLVVPNENPHPIFLQIDFALTKSESGIVPKLIELQGFPSLYAYQAFLSKMIRKHFDIPTDMYSLFNNLDFDSFVKLFKQSVLGDNDPEKTILMEINPDKQKTRIDFKLTEEYTGIKTICVTDVFQKGKRLFRKKGGKEIHVQRIYNRVIFDELIMKGIKLNFDFHDELDVEWAGHPNWFFKISKHTLPFLENEFTPKCFMLSELSDYPDDLENFVLKPLYSFAGTGVKVDVTKETLGSITDKQNYILQEKVEYAPIIETPDGYAKAEVRMMFLWNDEPILVNNLVRTSKGKMMGVDYNKNQTWIGASVAFHP